MNYFIKRDLNEYGPYSLADLQKYVASGNILLTDLCRSEGLTDWVPVSQVIGNIPVPAAAAPAPQPTAGTVYGGPTPGGPTQGGTVYGGTVYGGTPAAQAIPQEHYPPPPNLHWGICILLGVVTCGIFGIVWMMVEAVWVKKIAPASKAVVYVGIVIGLWVLLFFSNFYRGFTGARFGHTDPGIRGLIALLQLVFVILWLVAVFSMRNSIEEHYNSAEPIGLTLSGVMTFFFSVYYFQYHFTRINEMKQRQRMGYAG